MSHSNNNTSHSILRPSAPAPGEPHPLHEDTESAPRAALEDDDRLHELCEQLARWCRTRRFYGAPKGPASLLGRLQKPSRPLKTGEPDAFSSAEMSALYLALIAQPQQEPDRTVSGRRVFEAHYLLRVKNVKAAAAALGIGRQHYYTLLREFRRRIYAASRQILAENEGTVRELSC